jgi:signal transduction histidine kinase
MKKPVTKLTLLFIIAILIPGSVLTYFSLQNISSQQDLTEKKLLEEQDHIARYLTDRFHNMLQHHALSFYGYLDSSKTVLAQSTTSVDTMEFVDYSFIINQQKRFIRPNYYEASRPNNYQIQYTDKFMQIYSSAQVAEFEQADLARAAELYRNALSAAQYKNEQAAAINGSARVSAKQGLYSRSIRNYKILVENYSPVIDGTGYPFSYYALHQLMQFYPRISISVILPEINNILNYINAGIIPITDRTAYLIENLETWYQSLPKDNINYESRIPQQIKLIHKSLKFISNEGNIIKQYINNKQSRTASKIGPFNTISGSRDGQPFLIILRDEVSPANISGFTVNLNYVKKELIESANNHLQNSDIVFQILDRDQTLQKGTVYLSAVREFSSLVPMWRLWLQPKSPESVSQYIVKQRWIYGIAIAFLLFGMILGIVLVLRDMSREQKLAQLRTDFVSNITHELKTPLTSIRMFAETMRMGRVKEKSDQQEYLSVIVNESERLTRLINTVLDFSKIEQDEKQYHMHTVNLSKVIEKAADAMKYWLKENGFEIIIDAGQDIKITGDEDALEQTVLNLLSNAMKYSHNRKEIRIRLYKDHSFIRLEVQDRGLGIPESKQLHIFDKYYRAHSEHNADKGGSGLGLAVVKHIVDAHQGRIEVKSKVNEGTTFAIILPQKLKRN